MIFPDIVKAKALMITELIDNLKIKQRSMEANNVNTLGNNDELERMREQLEIMRQKLNRQKIVNDNLVSQAMSSRMSWIKRYVWLEIFVMIPLVAVMYAMFVAVFHISWWLYAAIMVACMADAYFDYRINKMNQSDWLAENLVATGRKLVEMKRQRKLSFLISLVAMAVLVVVFIYQMFYYADADLNLVGGIGGIIGIIIAIPVVFYIYRRMQRTNDELIRQIKELGAETD